MQANVVIHDSFIIIFHNIFFEQWRPLKSSAKAAFVTTKPWKPPSSLFFWRSTPGSCWSRCLHRGDLSYSLRKVIQLSMRSGFSGSQRHMVSEWVLEPCASVSEPLPGGVVTLIRDSRNSATSSCLSCHHWSLRPCTSFEEKQQIWKIRHDQTHPATVLLRSWPLPFRRKVWWHPRWSHCKEQVAEHPQFHSPHSFWAPLVGYSNYGQKNMGKYGKYKSGWGSNGWKQICIAKISQILQDNYSFCMNTNDKSHRLRLHDSANPLGSSVSLVMPAQGAPP